LACGLAFSYRKVHEAGHVLLYMKKTVVSQLKNNDDQLIGINVKTEEETFTIPVADVRRNREHVDAIIKASNIRKEASFLSRPILGWGIHITPR